MCQSRPKKLAQSPISGTSGAKKNCQICQKFSAQSAERKKNLPFGGGSRVAFSFLLYPLSTDLPPPRSEDRGHQSCVGYLGRSGGGLPGTRAPLRCSATWPAGPPRGPTSAKCAASEPPCTATPAPKAPVAAGRVVCAGDDGGVGRWGCRPRP